MPQRIQMGVGQIADMDVIANAGAVRGRVTRAVNVDLRPQAEGGFDRNLEQMRCVAAREPGAQLRVGAGNVEIAQDDVAEIVRRTLEEKAS